MQQNHIYTASTTVSVGMAMQPGLQIICSIEIFNTKAPLFVHEFSSLFHWPSSTNNETAAALGPLLTKTSVFEKSTLKLRAPYVVVQQLWTFKGTLSFATPTMEASLKIKHCSCNDQFCIPVAPVSTRYVTRASHSGSGLLLGLYLEGRDKRLPISVRFWGTILTWTCSQCVGDSWTSSSPHTHSIILNFGNVKVI
jgi:hypothetical protein